MCDEKRKEDYENGNEVKMKEIKRMMKNEKKTEKRNETDDRR